MTPDAPTGVHAPPSFDPALAALPLSLARADAGAPVAGVEGSEGWPSRVEAAIRAGSRAVVVDAPCPEPPADLAAAARTAEQHGAVVRLVRRWADDPALDGVTPPDDPLLVDVAATGPGSAWATLVEVRALLRRLFGAAPAWESIAGAPGSLAATSRLLGAPVVVSAVELPGVARVRVRVVTAAGRLAVELDDDLGHPGSVVVDDERGASTRSEIWETALRRTLRETVAALGVGAAAPTDLGDLADDVAAQPSEG